MAVDVQPIIKRAVDVVQDAGGVRWTGAEWVRWFNDGLRELAIPRPDAFAVTESVALVAGARQTLPTTAIKLIDIPCNSGGTMSAVRQIDRAELDAINPAWRAGTPSSTVKHFVHDPRAPLVFDVYPPATASGTAVDVVFAKYPTPVDEPADGTAIEDVTGSADVADIFANALLDYVLYRAFQKDDELVDAAKHAADHYRAFLAAIGTDLSAAATVAPGVGAPGTVSAMGAS